MAEADDWGGVAVSQPKIDDWGGVALSAPKIPDMAGAQKTAESNLSVDQNKETPEGGEIKPPPTPQERLDTAVGMPVQSVLNGGAKPSDVPKAMREHYSNAVKDGSVTDFGSFMQNTLHTVVPIAAAGIKSFNEVGDTISQTGTQYVGAMIYPFLSADNQQKFIKAGIVPKEGPQVEKPGQPTGPELFHAGVAPINQIFGTALSAPFLPVSAPLAPVFNPIMKGAPSAAETVGVSSGWAKEVPDALNLIMNTVGVAGLHYIGKQMESAGTQFPSGAGPWDNHPGSEVIRPDVAKQSGKSDASVTSEDIDQTIAKGANGLGPKGEDFGNVATAMGIDSDILHNIYKETGVHPEQVFRDAQANKSIAEDIGAGKIPAAYEHLLDKRPPIPDDVKSAMEKMNKLSEENSSVDLSKEGASTSSNPFSKIFNPTGMSEGAKDMATALRQGRGPENRDIAVIQDALKEHAKTFAKMSDEDRLKFISYLEGRSSGVKLDNPKLQEAADKIRDIYAQVGQKIQERFPDVGLRKDYFTHQFKDEAAAEKFFSDWVAKQGSERSLQARVFPTLEEAMKPVSEGGGGLEPNTTNPIETVMNYVNNMGNLMAAHRSLELAREMGIADYFREGQQPDGWIPLNGNLAEEHATPEGSNSNSPIKTGKILYAPEDAARIYNNDISEGATGPIGDILEGAQRVNNFGNMLVLSASLFHFTLTTMSSMAQDVGRALTTGTALERGGNLLSAVTPLSNTLKGEKYIQASLHPEAMKELSPELQKSIEAAWENNAVNLRNQDYWKAGPAKDYFDLFKNGGVVDEIGKARDILQEHKITGPVRILANEVGRVMNTISHPLMDFYIPRIKFAATIDNIHAWIKAHPDANPERLAKAVQDIGNNADNAFGEMIRENLFWHKLTQQTLQTMFLSYSWITGAARMAGKGIPDIGKTIMGKQELTADAKYLIGMAMTYTVSNGVMTYLKTGQPPDDPMDFIAYRTGGVTPQGKSERAFIPSHLPQYWHYLHDGIGELGNEMSPTLKMVYHLLANKDWRELPITNGNNTWFDEQKWGDYSKFVLGEETPIGIKTLLQGKKKGSHLSDLERFMGMRQTPRQFTDPEGYAAMMKRVNDNKYKNKLRSDKKIADQYESGEAP